VEISIQNTPGELVDPLDEQVAVTCAQSLVKYYPGHEWRVEVDRRKGFIDILNVDLSGSHGCRIPMNGYATTSELDKLMMRFGGEILERYNQPRGEFSENAFMDATDHTDVAGRLVFAE
jgi:hypothetical protein